MSHLQTKVPTDQHFEFSSLLSNRCSTLLRPLDLWTYIFLSSNTSTSSIYLFFYLLLCVKVSERSSFVAARSVDSATRPGGFKRVLPGSGLTLREVLHVEDDTRTSAPTPWRSHFPHPLPKGDNISTCP